MLANRQPKIGPQHEHIIEGDGEDGKVLSSERPAEAKHGGEGGGDKTLPPPPPGPLTEYIINVVHFMDAILSNYFLVNSAVSTALSNYRNIIAELSAKGGGAYRRVQNTLRLVFLAGSNFSEFSGRGPNR